MASGTSYQYAYWLNYTVSGVDTWIRPVDLYWTSYVCAIRVYSAYDDGWRYFVQGLLEEGGYELTERYDEGTYFDYRNIGGDIDDDGRDWISRRIKYILPSGLVTMSGIYTVGATPDTTSDAWLGNPLPFQPI